MGTCPVCGSQGRIGGESGAGVEDFGVVGTVAVEVDEPGGAPQSPVPPAPDPQEEDGRERREELRVPLDDGSVSVGGGGRGLVLASAADQYEVNDLSLSGMGLRAEGSPDKAMLCGFRKPALKIGEELEVRIQIGGLLSALDVRAKVVRIDQVANRNDFRIGLFFHQLSDSQRSELKTLCARQLRRNT